MQDYLILRRIHLADSHRSTGKTRHYRGGRLLPPPAELRIAQDPDGPGYYLFYYDSRGFEQTDTYHDSLEKALKQAEAEFGVKEYEWKLS